MYFVSAVKLIENSENFSEYPKGWSQGIETFAYYEKLEDAMKHVSGEGTKHYAPADYQYTAIEEIKPGFMGTRKLIGVWKDIRNDEDEIVGHQKVEFKWAEPGTINFALTLW